MKFKFSLVALTALTALIYFPTKTLKPKEYEPSLVIEQSKKKILPTQVKNSFEHTPSLEEAEYCKKISVESKKNGLVIFKNISKLHITRKEKESLLNLAGVDIIQYRKSTSRFGNYSELTPVEGEPMSMLPEYKVDFYNSLLSKNYEYIIHLLSDGELSNNNIFGSNSILSAIFVENKEITLEQIKELHLSGLKIRTYDLSVATRLGFDNNILDYLFSKHDKEGKLYLWEENNRITSLPLISAEVLNYENVIFWYNLGFPLTIEDEPNIIDAISIPKNKNELSNALKILDFSIDLGIKPYSNYTYDKIKSWLPKELMGKYDILFSKKENDKDFNKNLSIQDERYPSVLMQASELSKLNEYNLICKMQAKLPLESEKKELLETQTAQLDSNHILFSFNRYVNSKNWSNANKELEKLYYHEAYPSLLNIYLIRMIESNAPFEMIDKVIRKGAKVSSPMIKIIVIKDNIHLMNQLNRLNILDDFKNIRDLVQDAKSEEMKNILISFS